MQTRLAKDEHVHDPQEVSPLHFKDMRSFFSNGFPKIIEWVDLLSPSKKYQKLFTINVVSAFFYALFI